jgi:hypothetical protein
METRKMNRNAHIWGYTNAELQEKMDENRVVIFAYRSIYELKYSKAQQSFKKVPVAYKYSGVLPLMPRGRHIFLTPKQANKDLGIDFFNV